MSDIKIKRALIAVYDKTGIVEFARALVDEFGIEIISTGGTAKHLKAAGIPVTMVEQVTGFPEMLDGRVKTLHPMIHAGILADRDKPDHMRQLAEHGIKPIDMVVVNLYPFEQTIAKPDCKFEDAIEMIDIGGPCLLRAAAKNHKNVLVVSLRPSYEDVLQYLRKSKEEGGLDTEEVKELYREYATNGFLSTARYDMAVSNWLEPACEFLGFLCYHTARYGENPHQEGRVCVHRGVDEAMLVPGVRPLGPPQMEHERIAHMSFNNYVDGDAAVSLVKELSRAASELRGRVEEPRASARAVPRTELKLVDRDAARAEARGSSGGSSIGSSGGSSDAFESPDPGARTWLLTWTTYGQWLPGDARGFVSRTPGPSESHTVHNIPGTLYAADQKEVEESARERMTGTPVELGPEDARIAYDAFVDTGGRHSIALLAVAVMSDHVHVLCQSDRDGSELLQLFKGNSARLLGKQRLPKDSPRWWTKSGSKWFIKPGEDLTAAVAYVEQQSGAMCMGSCRTRNLAGESEEPRASARAVPRTELTLVDRDAARAEARGSSGGSSIGSLGAPHVVAFIKHTNACGCAIGDDPADAYRRAYLGDPIAAAGGVLCVNFPVTREFANVVMNSYGSWGKAAGAAFFKLDVWIAPEFDEDAVKLITTPTEKRKWGASCRLLAVGDMDAPPDPNELDYKKITGGMLVQTRDLIGLNEDQWKVVSKRTPSEKEMADLRFAWLVCKHTKSNAITVVRDGMLLGNGAGQMSRVKSCDLAIQLARENGHADQLAGAVAAGDAFFPVEDGPAKLISAGVTAIIHPGGSNRDADSIRIADEANVAMIMTGTRHFKH